MSELVEDSFFTSFSQIFSPSTNSEYSRNQLLNGLALLIERANTQGYNFKVQQSRPLRSEGVLKAIAHLKYSESIFDFLVQILVDLKNKQLRFKTSFLHQENYYCASSSAKRKIVCRKLLKINTQIQFKGLKFIQDIQNGKIILLSMTEESQYIFRSKDMIWTKLKANLRKICLVCGKYWMQIFRICDKERYKKYVLKNGGDQLKRIKNQEQSYAKLVKQLEVSHINFGFSSRAEESSFPTSQNCQQQQSKLKELLMNTSSDKFESNSKRLFLCDYDEYLDVYFDSISYQVPYYQAKTYGSYLKNPVPRDPNPGQNKFIFNHIEVVKPANVKFRETHLQGGKNYIMAAKASFYYCESSNWEKLKSPQAPPAFANFFSCSVAPKEETKPVQLGAVLTKMIAVKVPKKRPLKKVEEQYENQKKIVQLFKNGVSAYILKYYVSRQGDFEFRDHLLVDYLPNSLPLSNYIQIFRETLSLNSKAYIIVNLVNSIRFLNDYEIVHMDLNLNNFLMCRDYLTKLIDFGEAYSPNVHFSKGTNFKRGYTFPFCSPEYFQRKSNFTSKQDVFSLGIIIWRLVFNEYPFFTSDEALQSYKNKTYLNRIMLAPERGQEFGAPQTIDFIYRLVFKCISPNELIRCQTSWLTIFFKIIYFYLL